METLPPDVVKYEIFSYLDSLEVLACRYTCKSLYHDTKDHRAFLSHGEGKSTKFWRWLYSIIECWCYQCEPMSSYLYWLVRVGRYQTIAGFFNSYKYNMIVKHCPEVIGRCMLGACARGDMRIAKLVRGSTPHGCYRRNDVLSVACKHDHTKLFVWLVDMQDIPDSDVTQSFNVCIYIGEQGNLTMMRTIVTRGFHMNVDHWWLTTIHAMNRRHNHILRYVYAYAPDSIYTRRFFLATITNDNPQAFRVYLEKTNEWPTIEDSEMLRLYNAVKVARIWDMLGFPLMPQVQAWYNFNQE